MHTALLEALESGSTVVTANKRLTRTLRYKYEQRKLACGAAAWNTPDSLSWAHWLQRLWQESRLRSGQAVQHVLLDDATADLIWQQCIALAEQHRAAIPLTQYARSARKAWKLLNDWDAVTAEEWVSAGHSPDQQAFLRWSGAFRERCAEAGWIDHEQLAGVLRKDVCAGLFDDLPPVILAGFDDLTPAMKAFCEALRARGISVTTPPDKPGSSNIETCGCPTQDDELLAAARWARSCLEKAPTASVGVVIPDLAVRAAEVRRVFLDIFAPDWRVNGIPAGLPLDVSYGQPLADVPSIYAALLLLRLTSGSASFNELSLLVRSPWFRGAEQEAAGRARLDIEWRDKLRLEVSLPELLTESKKHAPQMAAMLQTLVEKSRDRQKRTTYEWALWVSDLLTDTGWAADGPPDSETWQALQSWNELLGMFARSGTVLGKISRLDAISGLSHLAQQRLFQPEGSERGVEVLGVLEAAGQEYDALWIAGMASELWPAAGRPNPFIPLSLQRRLQMPDSSAGQVLEYTQTQTRRLIASGTDVVISWPKQMDGEELGPSPLIAMHSASVRTVPDSWPTWNQQVLGTGQQILLENDPPPPLVRDARVRGGAAVLNRQAVSPLNAFIEQRLGAFELRRPPAGISAMDRGNISHKALELFYARNPSQGAVAALSPEQRNENLRSALDAGLKSLDLPNNRFMQILSALEAVQQLRSLEAFVAVDLERPDFEIKELEKLHEVRIGPLNLRLKLDRLDRLPDGNEIIIDYKTGQVNRQSWNPAKPRDLQLPLYLIARVPNAAGVAFARIAANGSGYEGVGDPACAIAGVRPPGGGRGGVRYQYPQTEEVIDSWEELRAAWGEVLLTLAEQFVAGDFRLDPRNPDSATGQFAILSRVYDAGIGLFEDDA